MILNTTYLEKDVVKKINTLVGEPFSLIKRFKMKGVGSHRMIIDDFSAGFNDFFTQNMSLHYCNFELRPNGIMVHFSYQHGRYSWVIPYYRLSMFRSNSFSIHSEGEFLRIRNDNNLKINSKIIKRILSLKEINMR
ncbi:MAG: hypothetical protein QNK84_06015 [Flavobacteriales bacterium]|jgi:hypothetical protein|tara:strand:+ start:104 stop:511 length:408 start_codon:yes stop_codon:yes gene_type:complete